VFTRLDLITAYERIYDNFALPKGEAIKVAQELETHTGLLVRVGAEHFEFSHKSLQEYLAAEHIVRLPSVSESREILLLLPNELAIATAISSRPSEYLAHLILERLSSANIPLEFLRTFINRLLLKRPDFDHSGRISAALLSLYSQCVHAQWFAGGTSNRQRAEQDGQLDNLGRIVKSRLPPKKLRNLYRVLERLSQGGATIWSLEKKYTTYPFGGDDKLGDAWSNFPSVVWVFDGIMTDD